MLDIAAHSRLAEATAEMMRACALATARAASTSMLQSMSFWPRMLYASAAHPAFAFPSGAPALANAPVNATSPQVPAEPPADTFASYRSSGGHAVAQVIIA